MRLQRRWRLRRCRGDGGSREAAPCESRAGPGWGRSGRLPYLSRPLPDPWGRVTAGALPYLPGAAQTLSGSGKRRDLITYLPRVAWFPQGRCGSQGWVAFIPQGSWGVQRGGAGCGSRVGGLRISIGVGLRRRVYHIFSRVALAPGVGKVVPGWGVRWVGSALLMEAAI